MILNNVAKSFNIFSVRRFHVQKSETKWHKLVKIVFFFIGLAVLGNRWHPHVDIRFIHCQLIGLAYFLFCTGS